MTTSPYDLASERSDAARNIERAKAIRAEAVATTPTRCPKCGGPLVDRRCDDCRLTLVPATDQPNEGGLKPRAEWEWIPTSESTDASPLHMPLSKRCACDSCTAYRDVSDGAS
jgi:hypothetical protein